MASNMNEIIRQAAGRVTEQAEEQERRPVKSNAGNGTGAPPKRVVTMNEIIRRETGHLR